MGATLDPDFYHSFELPARLPGQSQLHVQVWDYNVLVERMIGETVIDLEDRLFSKTWLEMQQRGEIPKETRALSAPGSTRATQGEIVLKVEILERKVALASPMVELELPPKDLYELRIIIWEARGVVAKDMLTKQSDVFVTVQPRGSAGDGSDYENQKTDVHPYSTGDAEFNWRMVWPVALPEKVPRLLLQVWDDDVIGADDAIGEAELNVKHLYDRAMRKKGQSVSMEKQWVATKHANFTGVQAEVLLSIELLTLSEARAKPAGRGQEAPNAHPHLEKPHRPSFWDGFGVTIGEWNPFAKMRRMMLILCCCVVVIAGVAVAYVVTDMMG